MSARPWRMVASSQPNKSAMYLQPPCPSFSASTAAYLRRSFSHKDWYGIRIWCSMCAEYMVYLPDRKQTRSAPDACQRKTATRNREVILRLPLSATVLKTLLGELVYHKYDEAWLITTGPLGKDAKGF